MARLGRQEDALLATLSRLCDGSLGEDDFARLAERLGTDPEARRVYIDYLDMHGELRWNNGPSSLSAQQTSTAREASPGEAEGGASAAHSIPRTRSPWSISLASAGLAVALGLFLLGLWRVPSYDDMHKFYGELREAPSTPPRFVARLTRQDRCVWSAETAAALTHGANLPAGQRLELEAGMAEIRYAHGAVVVIEAPTRFVVNTESGGFLQRGKLTASVPPRAAGFRIATRRTTVIDLGTEFFVDATNEHAVDVAVLTGRVEVVWADSGAAESKQGLLAGEWANISALGVRTRPLTEADIRQAPRLTSKQQALAADHHYRFENNSLDSASGAHGVDGADVRYAEGKIGRALLIGGDARVKDVVQIPHFRSFNPHYDSFSSVFWVKRLAPSKRRPNGVFDALDQDGVGYQAFFMPSGELRVRLDDDEGNHLLIDSVHIFDDEAFHHVALTVDRQLGRAIIYIDGRPEAPVDLSTITGRIAPSQALRIGDINGNMRLEGLVDELRFIRRVLSEQEVAAFFAEPTDAFESPTVNQFGI